MCIRDSCVIESVRVYLNAAVFCVWSSFWSARVESLADTQNPCWFLPFWGEPTLKTRKKTPSKLNPMLVTCVFPLIRKYFIMVKFLVHLMVCMCKFVDILCSGEQVETLMNKPRDLWVHVFANYFKILTITQKPTGLHFKKTFFFNPEVSYVACTFRAFLFLF